MIIVYRSSTRVVVGILPIVSYLLFKYSVLRLLIIYAVLYILLSIQALRKWSQLWLPARKCPRRQWWASPTSSKERASAATSSSDRAIPQIPHSLSTFYYQYFYLVEVIQLLSLLLLLLILLLLQVQPLLSVLYTIIIYITLPTTLQYRRCMQYKISISHPN